ncbi:MAG: hypothetical protein IJN43_14860, partial [Ruminococcus sp.]|nr:hypothetical protein [Ruminococcus sp.]
AMHDICCVNLPRSAAARLRKVSLQLPHLSVFSLIKRVFRDALKKISLRQKNLKCGSIPAFFFLDKFPFYFRLFGKV